MPIAGILQPEILPVSDTLRLRRYDYSCDFALGWYQDVETLQLVNNNPKLYDRQQLDRMYNYLNAHGEEYWIEALEDGRFIPIGDVTFSQDDLPIVIGERRYRGQGVGRQVLTALIGRAKELGFSSLKVAEIYRFNLASQRLFEGCGFVRCAETEAGFRFALPLKLSDELAAEGKSIRHAKPQDLGDILKIYASARKFMADNGNPTQWGGTFPPRELVEEDIRSRRNFVCLSEGRLCGVFALIPGEDPTYIRIDGQWINDAPYCALHRLAGDGVHHGIGAAAIRFSMAVCNNLRIDTHEQNLPMQRLLEQQGFIRCGWITVADGTPRIAYQKTL